MRSSIDLGTNTCLLLIADDELNPAVDLATVVRLGEGVAGSGKLQPQAMERTLACLRTYSQTVKDHGLNPAEVVCVATASARDSDNGAEFFEKVHRDTGFEFRTISGEEEARLSFEGAVAGDPTPWTVIDIGGGSTEFVTQTGGVSLPLGSVKLTEKFLHSSPVVDQEFWDCRAHIDGLLGGVERRTPQLLGVAGTVTTLAQWYLGLKSFDAALVDGCEMSKGDLHRMVEELKWRTAAERVSDLGIEEKRADVILAGALILWRACEVLGFAGVRTSVRGLRYGLLKT